MRMLKKQHFILPAILFVLSLLMCLSFLPAASAQEPTFETKTLTEIPSPTIAGTSGSYIDDGVLYYASTGDTVGYKLDHSNIMFDFDFVPTKFAFPGMISLTLKATGLDRTQRAGGYSFILYPAGTIDVKKGGETISSANKIFEKNTKHNINIGAITEETSVRLILKVNGVEVINFVDSTEPLTSGTWFNICGEGGCSAEFHTTKKTVIPRYYTYTLSTLSQYPRTAGTVLAEVDKHNNISISSSGSTVGFNQYLQNFSLEMKINFSKFSWPANFYFSARASGFDRVMSSNLSTKGYSFRISSAGEVQIYKEKASLVKGSCGAISTGKDYVVEFGTVDINENSTYVFFAVNNKVCASAFDNDSPIQKYGYVNMNGDGNVACKISSSDTKVSPLRTVKAEKDGVYEIKTYFVNPISYKKMTTQDFSERNLKAISIADKTLWELKNNYYAKSGNEEIAPFEIEFENNVLSIKLQKTLFKNSTDEQENFVPSSISISKTGKANGLDCSSGFFLKQTYTAILS